MKNKTFDRLLFFSLFFLAYWFFGNLYEEIVMVPNHLTNPLDVLTAYHRYFVLSNPTYYFVPLTQLAILVVFLLDFKANDERQKRFLRKATIFGALSLVVTAFIVTQINLKLFSSDINQYQNALFDLSVFWLLGNGLRVIFVGGTLYFVGKTYLLRQSLKVHGY